MRYGQELLLTVCKEILIKNDIGDDTDFWFSIFQREIRKFTECSQLSKVFMFTILLISYRTEDFFITLFRVPRVYLSSMIN